VDQWYDFHEFGCHPGNVRLLEATINRLRDIIISAVLLLGTVLAGSSAALGGFIEREAYLFGYNMGMASFNASVKKDSTANSYLDDAQHFADTMASNLGVSIENIKSAHSGYSGHALHDKIASSRTTYKNKIAGKSQIAAESYRLGLFIGLAYGQTRSPQWGCLGSLPSGCHGGRWFSNNALKSVQNIVKASFSGVPFDKGLLTLALQATEDTPVNAYNQSGARAHILHLRNGFQQTLEDRNFGGPSGVVRPADILPPACARGERSYTSRSQVPKGWTSRRVTRGGRTIYCAKRRVTIHCPRGQIKVRGRCIPKPEVHCPKGQIKVRGRCIPKPEVHCPRGQIKVRGRCIPKPEIKTCEQGWTLVRGTCRPPTLR